MLRDERDREARVAQGVLDEARWKRCRAWKPVGFQLRGPNGAGKTPLPVNVQVASSKMSSCIRAHFGSQEGGGAQAVRATVSGKEKRYDQRTQHYWQPYNWPLIFLLVLVNAYVVWWRRNIYIAMLLHCSANTIGAALALLAFFSG